MENEEGWISEIFEKMKAERLTELSAGVEYRLKLACVCAMITVADEFVPSETPACAHRG